MELWGWPEAGQVGVLRCANILPLSFVVGIVLSSLCAGFFARLCATSLPSATSRWLCVVVHYAFQPTVSCHRNRAYLSPLTRLEVRTTATVGYVCNVTDARYTLDWPELWEMDLVLNV